MSYSGFLLLAIILITIGLAAGADIPFVFDNSTSSVSSYSSAQLESRSASTPELSGVPALSTPQINETLEFPITGGGNTPIGTTEKNVEDLKKTLDSKVEADNPLVVEEAGAAAGKYSGDYTIEQVSAIYGYLKENWHYLRDPRGVDYFKNASESLMLGKKSGCIGVGDCDDFAILMSALIESIGGTTRIILARNNTTGGHAYTEVYLGQLDATNNHVEGIIGWLKQEFVADKIYTHIDTDTKDVWLNLDWGADDKGNAHPGGPYFQGDRHYVICIRDKYKKVPLNLPEKANKPPKIISLTPDKDSSQEEGSVITWTAKAKDPDNDLIYYKFFLNDNSVTGWAKDNTWVWSTNDSDVGDNLIEVHARDGMYGHALINGFDDRKISSFSIVETKMISKVSEPEPLPEPVPSSESVPSSKIETINTNVATKQDTASVITDEAHVKSWQKTFGGTGEDCANSVCQTRDGGYIIAGHTWYNHAGNNGAWIIKTDANGNKIWDRIFGGSNNDDAGLAQQTNDGGYLIIGAGMTKTDGNGDVLWHTNTTFTFTLSGGSVNSAQQTSDGGCIIAGCTESYGTGLSYAWLIKTDANGN